MTDGRRPILLVFAGLLGAIGALIMNADSALVTAIAWSCIGIAAVLVVVSIVLPAISPDRKLTVASSDERSRHPVGLGR